ncbi:PAS domain S-box protein [Chitinibacter fontanus]|uniref:Virulence sensor protein BvgS n=1 Tax=Chitinibacter fontanus TaxID=1737446 RepID=A0A7D5VC69_9NEIS|nr:PAS domain S-box protein [Chitinibacter fontanus]QLI83094.1 PAS domain S-box protein [Chitinibacter fontanus]
MDKVIRKFLFRTRVTVAIVILIGLVSSFSAWYIAQVRVQEQEQVRFTQQCDAMINNLRLRVHSLALGLNGARVVPLMTKGALLPNHFRRYIEGRNLQAEFPGALGFGFIRRVSAADVDVYLELQRHYRPEFTIHSLDSSHSADKHDLFVVEYIEPIDKNRAALGLNVASELRRRTAAIRSMLRDEMTLTEVIHLVQAGKNEPGFLMLLPYYLAPLEGAQITTDEQRKESLIGWVYTPILASQLMQGLEKFLPDEADFEVYSGSKAVPDQVLYDRDNHVSRKDSFLASERKFYRQSHVELGGQIWTVDISAVDVKHDLQYWLPMAVLALGLCMTSLLAILLLNMAKTRNRALILADEMSQTARQRELQINAMFDSTPDAIVLADNNGRILSANHALEHIFGYSSVALLGANVSILMPAEHARDHDAHIKKYQKHGPSSVMGKGRALWGKKANGELFPIEISLNRFDFEGRTHLVAQISDITQRYAAEQALRNSQRQLRMILECSGLGTWDLNLQTEAVVFGGTWGEMLGYETPHIVPCLASWKNLVHPDDLELANAVLTAHINQKIDFYSCEMRMRTASGAWKWILTVGRVYERDEQGQVVSIAGIHLDIDSRKQNELMLLRREAELARLQSQLSGVINSATEVSIISTDTQGVIRLFSPGAERMVGYSAAEMLNVQSPAILHLPAELAARAEQIREQTGRVVEGFDVFVFFAKQGLSDTNDWTYVCKNGTQIQVRLSVTAILDDAGEVNGYVGVAINVTEQKRLNEAMATAKEMAESANRAKSDFLANMSHEIRTPMNAVIGFSNLLADTGLTPVQLEYVNSIEQSGEALLNLINDLLDFSKIEAGHLELETIEFDLRHTFEGALDIVSEKAGRQGLDLACLIEPSVPKKLIGDPARLRQIMLNLLNNAIKFTPAGEVVVRVSAVSLTQSLCRVRVTVKDTGIGLTAQGKDKLFKPFTQADSSTTRKFGGTGLGLSICKRLVEAMNGLIGVESTLGEGALFWFEIELGLGVDEVSEPSISVNLSGSRVLVVDDFAANRELLTLQLEAIGVQASCVSRPAEALDLLRANTGFAVAVIDMQLPEMDGLALANELHSIAGYEQLPLILLTSMAVQGLAADAKAAGYSAFLTKPIRQNQLYFALEEALKMRHVAIEDKQLVTVHLMQEQLAAQKPYVLLAEDNPINQKVAVLMLEKLGCRVDVAANGLSAFEAAQQHSYDLVLMDCQMPEMDGFAATRAIRALGAGFTVLPIVALTANAFQSDIDECMQAGMNDFVSKPIRADELQRVLIRWSVQEKQK